LSLCVIEFDDFVL
jgi:hypothetical protein